MPRDKNEMKQYLMFLKEKYIGQLKPKDVGIDTTNVSEFNAVHRRHNFINTKSRTGGQPQMVCGQFISGTPGHEKSHWNVHDHRNRKYIHSFMQTKDKI